MIFDIFMYFVWMIILLGAFAALLRMSRLDKPRQVKVDLTVNERNRR